MRIPIQLTALFFLLFFLQIWLFDNIRLFGVATPILYVYFLIKLPGRMNRNVVMLLSVLLGFFVDVFGGTLGLSMTAMTITSFLRHYLLKIFAPEDVFEDYLPSFSAFGKYLFMQYAGIATFIHIALIFVLESLSLFNPLLLLLRIAGSFILTILLIFAFESINFSGFKK